MDARLDALETRVQSLTEAVLELSDSVRSLRLELARDDPAEDRRERWYAVVRANGTGTPGLYNSYTRYCAQVISEDRRASWSGRGKIPLAPESHCEAFWSLREARAFYVRR